MTSFDTGTTLAATVTKTASSSGTFVAQTWMVLFKEPVRITSLVRDLRDVDTYTFSVDGVNVATATTTTVDQTNVTFTLGTPLAVGAGFHTFKVIGTANRRYPYVGGTAATVIGTGAGAVISWGTWAESTSNCVPGTLNFNPPTDTYTYAQVDQQTSSTSTTWAAQSWDVGISAATSLDSLTWWAKDADTYTFKIDGTTVATATATALGQIAFTPSSPVALSAATHTFSVQGTASRRFYYSTNGTPTPTGDATVVSSWGNFQEFDTSHSPAAILFFVDAGVPSTSGTASLTLTASGTATGPGAGSATLSISASGTAAAAAGGAATLAFDASGTGVPPGGGAGDATLTLTASGLAGAGVTGAAALSVSAAGAAGAGAAGSASLNLSAHAATATLGPYGDAVMADAPVGYWRLGEPSGDTAADVSGSGNDGTFTYAVSTDVVHGVAGAIAGDADTATKFRLPNSGTQPKMTAPSSMAAEFTVEGWFNGRTNLTWFLDSGVGAPPLSVEIGANDIDVRIADGLHFSSGIEVPVDYNAGIPMLTAGWHHLAVTRDLDDTLTIYLDGAVRRTFTSTIAPKSGAVTLHLQPLHTLGGIEYVTADEVALYDHALASDRVAAHYLTGHGASGTASLSLSAGGTVTGASARGTAVLSFSALGQVPTPTAGAASLEFDASGLAVAVFATDLSNAFDGLDLVLTATVTMAVPVVAPPPTQAVRFDKAVPYPVPVMVDGRPT